MHSPLICVGGGYWSRYFRWNVKPVELVWRSDASLKYENESAGRSKTAGVSFEIIKMEDVWSGPEPRSTDRSGIFRRAALFWYTVCRDCVSEYCLSSSIITYHTETDDDTRGQSRIIHLSVGQKWQILENKKLCSVNKY